jgi:hypothetical protein
MTLTITHAKTNNIADWTQADLDAQIALGNFPPGTLLADIVLPSDWNDDHMISGTPDAAGSNGQMQYNNGGVLGGAADVFYEDTTGQTALGATTFIGDERLRVLAATLYINDATDAEADINYGQSSGIPTLGYTFTYRVYGYKTIDGTTYYSATYSESTPVQDDSRTLSAPTPTGFTGSQIFSGGGYTDGTNVWDFRIVPYKDYPAGRATGTSQLVTITEGNTGNTYRIDFSWNDVSATGYYILRQQNGGGYTDYVDMGNTTSFSDFNNSWSGGSISYPQTVVDYYDLTVTWTDPGDLDGFIVLREDNYNNYSFDYYQDVGLVSSFNDTNSGWTSPVPNTSVNSYLGPWLHAEGDSTVIGDETRTGAVTMSGKVTAYNFSTDTANYRTSVGEGVTTSATYSTAIGFGSIASAIASTALGTSSIATGGYSTAAGLNSSAGGDQSTALGYSSSAGTAGSTALGWSSNASGIFGTAIGYLSLASGTNSISIGTSSYSVFSSTAIGNGAYASGQGSTAIGGYASNGSGGTTGGQTTASALNTTAIGAGAQATASNAVSIGRGVTNSVASTVNIGTNASTYMTLNSSSLGSSGQMYYNASNVLAPTSQIAYVNSGTGITHLTLTSSQATNKGLIVKGAASQTGNLIEAQTSAGTAYVTVNGKRTLTANGEQIVNIDGLFTGNSGVQACGLNVTMTAGNGTAATGTLIAHQVQANTSATSNGLTSLTGAQYYPSVSGTQNVPAVTALRCQAFINSTASITNYYGITTADIFSQGGVVQNQYGLLIASLTTATNNYAISTGRGLVNFGDLVTITVPTSATKGQIIKGAASQTANLQEWQNSSGTVLASIGSSGQISALQLPASSIGNTITFQSSDGNLVGFNPSRDLGMITFQGNHNGGMRWISTSQDGNTYRDIEAWTRSFLVRGQVAASPVAIIRAATSQTANLQEWQNSSGTAQLAIAANGRDFVLDTTTGTKIGTATTQKLAFWNATPVVQSTGWSATNVTTDKSFDANATTIDELADVVGTLIEQLKTYGILGA